MPKPKKTGVSPADHPVGETPPIDKRPRRRSLILKIPFLILLIGTSAILSIYLWIQYHYRESIYTVATVPPRAVALVFGAGVWPDGRLSDVLADRVATAAQLYQEGKAQILLMSGDNRFVNYNEPQAMKEYALSLGVPEEAIVLDYAGRSTYDSCYRARDIFQVDQLILVTQSFHLPRALFICHQLGIDAVGVRAERRSYIHERWYAFREFPATIKAWWDVSVAHPTPVLGEPLPIHIPSTVEEPGGGLP